MPPMRGANGRFIASGAAVLTADADPFASGLHRAASDLDKWGVSVGKRLSALGGDFRGRMKDMLAVGIGAGIGTSLTSSISSAIQAAPRAALDSLMDLSKQNSIAKSLGMTTEQFTGIAGVAKSVGEDTREFVESLVTMGKLGSDAARGIGEVAGPAFAALNLNAAEFVKMRPDQQFFAMFEALSSVSDGLTRTRLIMNAFGEDGGKYLLPLLSKSPSQLREMAAGFAVSGAAAKSADAANEAWKRTQQSITSAIREAAVSAAPALTSAFGDLSKAISENKDSLTTLANSAGSLFRDTIVPATKQATDFAASFVRVSAAVRDTNRDMDALKDSQSGQDAASGGFWSRLPQGGKEFGESVATSISMVKDAWRDVEGRADNFRQRLHGWFGGYNVAARPDSNPYERTERALDRANGVEGGGRPPREYGGLFNRAAAMNKPYQEMLAKSKESYEKFFWKYKFLDPKRYDEHTVAGAFGDSGIGKMISGFGGMAGGLAGIGSALKLDSRPGAGSWAGGLDVKAMAPKFAAALDQGSMEAVQREAGHRFAGPWVGDIKDAGKEQVKRLDVLARKLDKLIGAVEGMGMEVV